MTPRFVVHVALLTASVLSAAAQTKRPEAGADLFVDGPPRRFEVQLSTEAMASLRTQPREDVSGTVRADGITYTNVAIHLKGVATFRPVDAQPSLTLNFSKLSPAQRFHGLRKIHLNN